MPSKSKKGGSLASDAVTELVSSKAFEKMSMNASNVTKSGGKRKSTATGMLCAQCGKKISGGNGCRVAAETPKRGGSGGTRMIKNINEYKTASPFKLWNGRGGNPDKPVSIGLKSDSSITSFDKLQGTMYNRAADATVMKILANEVVTGPIPMNKTAHFGNVTGTPELDTKFAYVTGGKKKKRTA